MLGWVPAVLGMALRATVNWSTVFTPNMLQLGHEVNMPADILLGLSRSEELPQSQGQFLKTLLSRMEVHHQARQHLRQAQLTQKKYYDLKARSQRFAEGDLLYKKNMGWKAGLSRKLCPFLWVHLLSKLYCQMICTVLRDSGRRKQSIMIVSANVRTGPYLSGYAVGDIWMVMRSKVMEMPLLRK